MKKYLYFRILAILLFTCLLFQACNQSKKKQPTLPNVVLIISDDQAWEDYSFMGNKTVNTPSIDKLASESLVYTRGYLPSSLCSPSLATLATGLYPRQHRVTGNDPSFTYDKKRYTQSWLSARKEIYDSLIDYFVTLPRLPELLKERGYVSFQSGKWWLGHHSNGGFDYGMTHGNPEKGGRHGDFGLEIGRKGMDTLYNFIEMAEQKKKPFFVWYAPFLPHSPHNSPDSILKKYISDTITEAQSRYRANVEWFDNTVGQLKEYLDSNGLSENTVVIYVCDNGWVQDPNRVNRYAPRSKRSPYDMGLRTPIMVKWPNNLEPDMDTTTLVSSLDIVPSILKMANIRIPEEMKGLDLLNKKNLLQRNRIYGEIYAHDMADIMVPSKSLQYEVAIEGEWKLIQGDSSLELYNIIKDPYETRDLSMEEKAKVLDLKKVLRQFNQSISD